MAFQPTLRAVVAFACLFPLVLVGLFVPAASAMMTVMYGLFALALLLDGVLLPRPRAFDLRRENSLQLMQNDSAEVATLIGSRAQVAILLELWEDELAAGDLGGDLPAQRLLPGGTARFARSFVATRRGSHSSPRIKLRWRTALGLVTRSWRVGLPLTVTVFPDTRNMPRAMLLAKASLAEPEGQRRLRLPEEGSEFDSLRDYVRGDDPRHIEWKVSARRRATRHSQSGSTLVVKTYEVQKGQVLLVAIDRGRLMATETRGVSKLDRAIEAALVLVGSALARRDSVGIATFSANVEAYVPPGRRAGQLRLALETLHDTFPSGLETNFARSLSVVRSRLKRRALVLVLSDFVDSLTAGEMVEQLHSMARRHRVVFVGIRDPYLDDVLARSVTTTDDLFRKTAALSVERDRQLVLTQLRHSGLEVLDLSPDDLNEPTLNCYLRLVTGRG